MQFTRSGQTFACLCPSARLSVISLWGKQSPAEVDELFAAIDAISAREPEALFLDARHLYPGAPDPAAFERATRYLPQAWRRAAPLLRKAALAIEDRGLQGTLIAGTLHLLDGSVPLKPFRDPLAALRWLDAPEPERLLAAIDELRGAPPVVSGLRVQLDQNRGSLRLPDAARRMGHSVRSLQRHLDAAGTSFRSEVEAARLRAAEELLASTSLKISAIAAEVGCQSAQHFSAFFRRARGITPRQFRATREA